eukprot:g65046.t1
MKARESPGAAALEGKVYAVGGLNASDMALASAEVYDPATNTWAYIASMQTPRHAPAAVVLNHRLYAIGGFDSNGNSLHSVECYNPYTHSWSTVGQLNQARGAAMAGVVEDVMYVVGGILATSPTAMTYLKTMESFQEASQTWTVLGLPLTIERAAGGLVTLTEL